MTVRYIMVGVDFCAELYTFVKPLMSEKVEKNECSRGKRPKRIIHFSDGSVPEYSSDEEDRTDATETCVVNIDPTSLGWMEWLKFRTVELGTRTLNVCDYLGDSLSSFFGITTPKYQFEIDHFNMMKKLEAENSDAEMGAINEIPQNNKESNSA